MKRSIIPVVLSLLATRQCIAQIVPAEDIFQLQWITPQTTRMNMYVVSPSRRTLIGEVMTRLTVKRDTVLVVTDVMINGATGSWVDSTLADKLTGRPIYHSSFNSQRNMVLRFGKIVTGWYEEKQKGVRREINDTLPAIGFDNNLYPALLGWLPLSDGYRQELLIYDFSPLTGGGLKKAFIHEVKPAVYATATAGVRKVWRVAVSDEISTGIRSVYYFDQEDRRLWKQEIYANENITELVAKE